MTIISIEIDAPHVESDELLSYAIEFGNMLARKVGGKFDENAAFVQEEE